MPDTIRGLIAVIVPNLALCTRDVEAFEDTPLEHVRAELHVSEVATPRQAAAEVVKALGSLGADSESASTSVALEWIGRALAEASGSVVVRTCGRIRMQRCTSSRLSQRAA